MADSIYLMSGDSRRHPPRGTKAANLLDQVEQESKQLLALSDQFELQI